MYDAVTRTLGPFLRLATLNVARRPSRAFVLAAAVAVGVGAAFATLTARRAAAAGTDLGLARLGADAVVLPRDALGQLTPALLAAEPSPHSLDPGLAGRLTALPGVAAVAPQRAVSVRLSAGGHDHDADLILFDPARDLTVLPWRLDAPGQPPPAGGVLIGGRRPEPVGAAVTLSGKSFTVAGRLGLTGVGPFDRAFFVSDSDAAAAGLGDPGRPTAVFVRLAAGGGPEGLRFALAGEPGVKVVAGTPAVTAARQAVGAVLGGAAVLTGLMLACVVLLVAVAYSAVVAERRREFGLLLAVGARRGQVAGVVLAEAAVTAGLGGVAGVALGAAILAGLRRTLGFALESADAPLALPAAGTVFFDGLGCVVLACGLGVAGALGPAWRAAGRDPYDLARGVADG